MDSALKKILDVSYGEKFDFDTSETWLNLFKRQVKARPNQISVADDEFSMTYAELDTISDKISAWLLENGVREDDFIAIRMSGTKNFVAAVVGVQKIGAAYVPIDLDYSAERILYMIADSEAKITLTDELFAEISTKNAPEHEILTAKPKNLAYMIYTSGSTGKPKGVMIQHRALLNFIRFISHRWGLNEQSRIACHSNFAFDASVEDLFPALTVGGTVFIVPEESRRDVFELERGKNYNPIPIGRTLDNCAAFIVDKNNKLLPRGMIGELCLAGAQISA